VYGKLKLMGYQKTSRFLGKTYEKDNPGLKRLEIGDYCLVHPTENSISRKPYKIKIIVANINWAAGASDEICTTVKGGQKAVLNDYLFSRLSPLSNNKSNFLTGFIEILSGKKTIKK